MNFSSTKINRDNQIFLLIILVSIVSRLIFSLNFENGYGFDPTNYALAVKSYNISQDTPHLPGYYLHIQIIEFLNYLTQNSYASMIILSILYSSFAAGFLYLLLRRWFDIKISVLLTLVVLTNPMVWYYGSIPEIYSFDIFFGVFLSWIGLKNRGIYLTPFIVGFLSGVRPSSGVLILGLYIFLWYRHFKIYSFSVKKFVSAHLAGVVGFLLWFIPMIITTGGLGDYIKLYKTNNPIQDISFLQNWFGISSYLIFILPPFLILSFYFPIQKTLKNKIKEKDQVQEIIVQADFIKLMMFWLIPPLLFFVFYFYSKGYFLICIIPFFSLIIYFINKRSDFIRISIPVIILQVLLFGLIPYSKPDVQVYFKREAREINLTKVWWERTTSVYLMSQFHIRAMEKIDRDIKCLINNFSDSTQKILIDPTVPIRSRTYQVKFPHKQFSSLILNENNRYVIYSNTKSTQKTGWEKLFDDVAIISRTDFVKEYLNDVEMSSLRNSGSFSIFEINENEKEKLSNIYSDYFLR